MRRGLRALARRVALALAALAPGAAQAVPLSEEPGRFVYQVYVRAFYDGSPAPDGEGDFAGLRAKAGYLLDLGVGAVLLMPVFASSGGMGYIPKDYLRLDQAYGDEAQLKALIDELHRRGIKVILDSVFNHIAWDSTWFLRASEKECATDRDDPVCDYFYFVDDPAATAPYKNWHKPWDWDHTGVDAVFYQRPRLDPNRHRTAKFYATFAQGMPDLKYWDFPAKSWNEPVITEVVRALTHWAGLGADGFRIDSAAHFVEGDTTNASNSDPKNRALMARLLAGVRAAYPDTSFFGEVWADYGQIEPYFPDALDGAFDFPFMDGVRASVQGRYGSAFKDVLTHAAQKQATIPPGRHIVFPGNHDVDRLMTAFADDEARVRQAFFLTFLTPSPPMLLYGEELGMHGQVKRPDSTSPQEYVHTVYAFPWTGAANAGFPGGKAPVVGVADNTAGHNLATAAANPASNYNFVKRLAALRRGFAVDNATRLAVRDDLYGHVVGWSLIAADGRCLTMLTNFHASETYEISPRPADGACASGQSELLRENATRLASGAYALGPFAHVVLASAAPGKEAARSSRKRARAAH